MITFKAKTASGEIIKSAISEFSFPAGEAFIKVEPQRSLEPTEIAIIQPSPESLHDDLFKLAMWDNYLNNKVGQVKRVLVIPYFPGARADRISEGVEEPFGLEVYAEFIGHLLLDQIIIFDPHSEGVVNELKSADAGAKVTVVYSDELISQPHIKQHMADYTGIISPDKGALLRANAVAKVLDIPVYTAEKTRDPETGKLSGFSIDLPPIDEDAGNFYLIVDDICDGGGTFLGLVDSIGRDYGDVDLFVSHGVFSKNALENLAEKFEYIYTTNSYNPERRLTTEKHGHPEWAGDFNPFICYDVIHLLLSKVL